MLARSIFLGLLVFMPFFTIGAQHQWTSLDGPYWANGIDVAVGDAATSPGNRYLIGSDNTNINIYSWSNQDLKWTNAYPRSAAKRIISYRKDGSANGLRAFCAVYETDIFSTIDGGQIWGSYNFSGANNSFSSVEIVNWDQNPGQTVVVGTDFQASQPSAYYTDDFGGTWLKLGATSDPLDTWDVYDIETLPAEGTYPVITAGTVFGIYKHSGDWSTQWTLEAFFGLEVRVLESIDRWEDSESQVAAVNSFGTWKLYLTTDGWDTAPSEIRSGGQSFDKEVRDIAGIYWGGVNDKISCHVATDEGVFILHFSANDPGNAEEFDLKNDPIWGYKPMRYDQNIKAVDYFYKDTDNHDSVFVVATTPYNVYEIIEERDINYENPTLAVNEIVTGTYKCNVIDLSLAEHNNNPNTKRIFALSENGLVKRWYNQTWKFMGTAFDVGEPTKDGMSISTDFVGSNELIMVASEADGGGTVMFSSDGGDSWVNRTPALGPAIIALDLEPGSGSHAFAASDNRAWVSTNDGENWGSPQYFPNSSFNDIYAEPDPNSSVEAYVGGAGIGKVFKYENNSWTQFDNGLVGAVEVKEFTKSQYYDQLFAATSNGVYKNVDNTWYQKIHGTGDVDLGTIVVDPHVFHHLGEPAGYPGFLVGTSSGIAPGRIWASPDSGRSWNEMYNGDIGPTISINKISSCKEDWDVYSSGFVVGSELGIFYIGDIFKNGPIWSENWGPGLIMVTGDIAIERLPIPGEVVTVNPPCTVLVAYSYDSYDVFGDPNRSRIAIAGRSLLQAVGDENNRIVFESSRIEGGLPGDWDGISLWEFLPPASPLGINLQYCDLRHARKGVFYDDPGNYLIPIDTVIAIQCSFEDIEVAGIDLKFRGKDSVIVSESNFKNCGEYGIKVTGNFSIYGPAADLWVQGNTITDCPNGIYYEGNINPLNPHYVFIKSNVIDGTAVGQNAITGVHFSIYDTEYSRPVVEMTENTITGFEKGIYFNSIDGGSELMANTVESNGNYGLFLASSSPSIVLDPPFTTPNKFNGNRIGIYCDSRSSPYIRWTMIKDNGVGGVLIESHDSVIEPPPDFGVVPDSGYNSISSIFSGRYYDMKYPAIFSEVSAQGNWWGEPIPNPSEIVGNIDYSYYLTEDPLDGLPKRESWYAGLPDDFGMQQNFPNPFNPTTSVSFYLAEPGFAKLEIYNLNGQLVNTLIADHMPGGEHTVIWDGRNSAEQEVSSGIYFSILKTDYGKASKKMVLLR